MSLTPHASCQRSLDLDLQSQTGTALSSMVIGVLAPNLLAQHQHVPYGVALLGCPASVRWLPADLSTALYLFDTWTGEVRETGHALIMPRFERVGRLSFTIAIPYGTGVRLAEVVPYIPLGTGQLLLLEPERVPAEKYRPYFPDEPRLPIISDPGLALVLSTSGWVATSAAFMHGFGASPDDRSVAENRLQQIEPVLHLLAERGGLK